MERVPEEINGGVYIQEGGRMLGRSSNNTFLWRRKSRGVVNHFIGMDSVVLGKEESKEKNTMLR